MRRRAGRAGPGQATVELAVVLPLLLLVTLGIIQLALLFAGRLMVELAAWQAARAAAVGDDARQAAVRILSPGTTGAASEAPLAPHLAVPGWGPLAKSGIADRRLDLRVLGDEEARPGMVEVELTHEFQMLFPLGAILSLAGPDEGEGGVIRRREGTEYLLLTARAAVPRPWRGEGLPE